MWGDARVCLWTACAVVENHLYYCSKQSAGGWVVRWTRVGESVVCMFHEHSESLNLPFAPGRDVGHEGWTIQDFAAHPVAVAAGLSEVDVLALRLYTGKGYWLINNSCRAARPDFAVTAFVANRAIGRIARSVMGTTPSILYVVGTDPHVRWCWALRLTCRRRCCTHWV